MMESGKEEKMISKDATNSNKQGFEGEFSSCVPGKGLTLRSM